MKDPQTVLATIRSGGLSSTAIRRLMAEHGWDSEDRITDLGWGAGRRGFSVWFRRWKWHGNKVLGNSVVFHVHTGDLSEIDRAVTEAAALAVQAWIRFPTCVPHQRADGNIAALPTGLQPEWAVLPGLMSRPSPSTITP